MRVVCDNCRAVYKIPDEKLAKPVNKATCRNCSHRMLIPRPPADPEERTLVTNNPLHAASSRGSQERGGYRAPPEPELTLPGAREPHGAGRPGRRVAGPATHDSLVDYDDDDDVPLLPGTPLPPGDRRTGPRAPPRPTGPHMGLPPEEKTSWVQNPPRHTPRPAAPRPPPPRATPRAPTPPPRTEPRLEQPREPRAERPSRADGPNYDIGAMRPAEEPTRINAEDALTPTPAPAREPAPARAREPEPPRHRDPEPYSRRDARPSTPPSLPGLGHDPSGDLSLALAGTISTLAGVFILAVDVDPNSVVVESVLRLIALLLAFGGGFTTLLVLLTSSRGRRPANRVLSFIVGSMIAGFAAFAVVGTHVAVEIFRGGSMSAADPIIAALDAPAAPLTPEVPPVEAPAPEPDVAVAAPEASKAPAPRPATTTRSKVTVPAPPAAQPAAEPPPSRPARITAPADDSDRFVPEPPPPRREPTPPPPPKSSDTMETVPMEVIDVMLRNNIDVKKCFFNYMQGDGNGKLPPRVDVRFTLEPTGRVSAAGISQANLAGSSLDSCLGGAIRGINFPPSTGPATKITFPFIFQ